jgi:hypothetical protein
MLGKLLVAKDSSSTINKRAVLMTVGGVTVFVAFLIGMESFAHSLSLTKQAEADLQMSTQARSILGDPVRVRWLIYMHIEASKTKGVANLSIPIEGSKAKARLYVAGLKENGVWSITDLHLTIDGSVNSLQIPR